MVDVREEEQRRAALMLERLRSEIESRRYDADTAFLVYSTDLFRIGVDARAELVGDVERYVSQVGVPTAGVYLVFQTDYTVMHVPGTE